MYACMKLQDDSFDQLLHRLIGSLYSPSKRNINLRDDILTTSSTVNFVWSNSLALFFLIGSVAVEIFDRGVN